MKVHDPQQALIVSRNAVHDDERRNFHLLHARERGGCELTRANGFRSPRHALPRRQVERVFAALLEQSPQIAVADHP